MGSKGSRLCFRVLPPTSCFLKLGFPRRRTPTESRSSGHEEFALANVGGPCTLTQSFVEGKQCRTSPYPLTMTVERPSSTPTTISGMLRVPFLNTSGQGSDSSAYSGLYRRDITENLLVENSGVTRLDILQRCRADFSLQPSKLVLSPH